MSIRKFFSFKVNDVGVPAEHLGRLGEITFRDGSLYYHDGETPGGELIHGGNSAINWTTLTGKPMFAIVATSGSYADLIAKPILFSGDYNDLTNKPILTTGPVGPAGPRGIQGNPGPQGLPGARGVQGIQGEKGDTGNTGPQGEQGLKGDIGTRGQKGDVGAQGIKGDTGAAGPAGARGADGASGVAGSQGLKGDTGATGPAGANGVAGAQGPQGIQGLTGATGPAGAAGAKGDTGATGATGPKGDTGVVPVSAALNYAQTKSNRVNYTGQSLPFTIVSATITTNGGPVQVIVTGDANPLSNGAWCTMNLYRGTTAVGQIVQSESSSSNENVPYALQVIDTPTAGTYTYSLKLTGGSGNFDFGEAAGPILSVVELQNVVGETGATGPAGAAGATGPAGAKGDTGAAGATGAQGPSGQGLINQTIILNAVAPSPGAYTAQDVTQWSASYTGTGGQLLITADVTAYTSGTGARNYYLKKNGTIVVTGAFFFNSANTHMTLPALRYVDTTGSTSAATWSITVGSGLISDTQDRATITVTEYTGLTAINASSVTASGNVSGSVLISTNASGNEGGEIQLAKSPNSTLTGSTVVIDQYADRVRFFEAGGTTRGAYIDLTLASAGTGTLLNNRASGFVNAGVDVTLGNLKVRMSTSGNRSLQVSTVSGTYSVYGSSTYQIGSSTAGATIDVNSPRSITTTPAYIFPSYNFGSAGSTDTWMLMDTSAGLAWRITLIVGASYNNNFISIERLV